MTGPEALGLTYCGPPPAPAQLWTTWNIDPVLLGAMAAATAIYLWRSQESGAQRGAFLSAQAVLLVAFVSPLCALSVALFSARIAHHMLMVAVAAPLLAYALPRKLSGRWLTAAALGHMALLWIWHAPQAYAWAVEGVVRYWLMEVTLLASATALWSAALARRREAPTVILTLILTMAQMGLLAALITFAQQPLFAPHLATTQAYGLTPLEDQQLAGLIMWAPGALPYFAAVIWLAAQWLKGLARDEAMAWRG